jgi:hypothetical protein
MVAIVIIVIMFVLGGLYFFIKQQAERHAMPIEEPAASATTAQENL